MKLEKLSNNFHKIAIGDTKIIYFSYDVPIAFFDGLANVLHTRGAYDSYPHPRVTKNHVNNVRAMHGTGLGLANAPTRDFVNQYNLEQAIIQHF